MSSVPEFDRDKLASICKRYQLLELALFGSAARGEMRADSDIDLLVEFLPEAEPSFMTLAGLQEDLAELVGRRVDLVPKKGLKAMIRESVLAESVVVYAV